MFTLACLLAAGMFAASSAAAEPDFPAEQLEFFETQIRPLLSAHCFECHSAKADKLKGGLRLDARPEVLRGGDSGPALVPGKSAESLLMEAVQWKSLEMPPVGKLSADKIALLAKWIELGAPWPAERKPQATSPTGGYDWVHWRTAHWAYQPVTLPARPAVRDTTWARNEIDVFLLAGLEAAGLQPAPPAAPRVLVRRIFLDLLGLPPAPDQWKLWADRIAASQPDSSTVIDDLVTELLSSPHYGERWGRYWLDVARYSDGYGGFLDNAALPEAWRYRDWVVQSLNADLPFDQFLQAQIAGDLTGGSDLAVATGFFALGPTYQSDGGDPDSVAQARAETLADRVDTLGRGMLALTLACARCHDHKFDAIPQTDYYALAGIFQNTQTREVPLAAPEVVAAYQQHVAAIAERNRQLDELQKKLQQEKREASDDEQQQRSAWTKERDELQATLPPKYEVVHGLGDTGSSDMPLAIRGDLRKPGPIEPRHFLRVLAGDSPPAFTTGSGRLALAEAVSDPANPLPARVYVNRVWLHHFGQGLVRTPGNFGALGERPTHPELLDWLTARFLASGGSTKFLHRTIIASAAYQMSSRFDAAAFAADGDHRLWWRMPPRRLDVEAWRDSLLSVTGELNLATGGPPVDNISQPRRTLYFKVSRNGDAFATDEFLRLFDFPLMRASVEERPTSIVPQQYLFLLNSPFMIERARALAARLAKEQPDEAARLEFAYDLLYGRPPTAEETEAGRRFLAQSPAADQTSGLAAWEQYAQVLLSANEFMYVR